VTDGTSSGRSLLAVVLAVAVVGVVVCMMLPPLGRPREAALRSTCISNEKLIGLAMTRYAKDHDDKLPTSLNELRAYVDNPRTFVCPSARDQSNPNYEIVAGGQKLADVVATPGAMLLRENPANHRVGGHVLFADGHVQWVPASPASN
jgi:prepilin-type processing-associated H-X9-DG protein